MPNLLLRNSDAAISIRHDRTSRPEVIVIAPGFFQSKETGTFRRIERDLLESFDVISLDFRGHGKSGGLCTFSAKEPEDLKAVMDYAKERYARVGVLGFSYGGTAAILQQAKYRNADSIVCVSSPMASREVEFQWWRSRSLSLGWRGLERGAGARIGFPFLKKTNAVDVVEKIAPTPIFFIHGDEDPTVFPRHSETMHARAGHPKKLLILPRASHAEDIYRRYPEPFIRLVTDWFRETLKK